MDITSSYGRSSEGERRGAHSVSAVEHAYQGGSVEESECIFVISQNYCFCERCMALIDDVRRQL